MSRYRADYLGRFSFHRLDELVGFSDGAVHVLDELIDMGVDVHQLALDRGQRASQQWYLSERNLANSYAMILKTDRVMHHNRSREAGGRPQSTRKISV